MYSSTPSGTKSQQNIVSNFDDTRDVRPVIAG